MTPLTHAERERAAELVREAATIADEECRFDEACRFSVVVGEASCQHDAARLLLGSWGFASPAAALAFADALVALSDMIWRVETSDDVHAEFHACSRCNRVRRARAALDRMDEIARRVLEVG